MSQETFANNDYGFQRFCDITLENLNKNAPFKIKYVWGNQVPFFVEEIS